MPDVILTLQALVSSETLSGFRSGNDVNSDGRLGLEEAVYILRKIMAVSD